MDKPAEEGPELPEPMSNHCFLSLNSTTAFLFYTRRSYYFDKLQKTWRLISASSFILATSNDEKNREDRVPYECSKMVLQNKETIVVLAGNRIRLRDRISTELLMSNLTVQV